MRRFTWVVPLLLVSFTFGLAMPASAQTNSLAAADLAVEKSIDNPTPFEGDTVTLSVRLTNDGTQSATNVQIDQLLPSGLTYVSSAATRGIYVRQTGIWVLSEVPSGATETLTIVAQVDDDTRGTRIVAEGTVANLDQFDRNASNDSDRLQIDVQGEDRIVTPVGDAGALRGGDADLAITKTVDDPLPAENDSITYTVVVDNNGPVTATNIQIDDLLPSGVTFSSSSTTQGVYISASGIWVLSSVASGAADTLTINATVDTGTAATTIVNTASVAALDQTDPNSGNDSDSAPITVAGADLAITKTVDDDFPNEGQTIVYTVTLDNNGPDAATNVQVTDLLPTGVTFSSSSPSQGTYASGTGVWVVGSVGSGSSATLTINATVDPGTGGSTINNSASVTASDQGDDIPGNDSDDVDITVQTLDLAIAKSVDDSFPNEGDTINYTLVLTNNGPDAGTNVEVTDALPSGVTFVSSSATAGSYDDGTGIWSVPSIANAVSDTLTISASIDAGTGTSTIINTATITDSDQADTNAGNDTDDASLTVQSVDLAVTKDVSDPTPDEGDSIDYTIVLTNNGPDTATNVTVTDVLPAGVTFVSSSATTGSYTSGTGVWSVPGIANAVSDTLVITATVDLATGGTTINNAAALTSSDQADSNPANDSDNVDIDVIGIDLAVTKTIDDANPNEGDTINYTVALTNNGPDTATNVEITDLLPAGTTFSSFTATQGTYTSGTGIWSLASLANAASDTLVITATVDAGTGGTDRRRTRPPCHRSSDQFGRHSRQRLRFSADDHWCRPADLALTKTVDDPVPRPRAARSSTRSRSQNNGPQRRDRTWRSRTSCRPATTYVSDSSATSGHATPDGTGDVDAWAAVGRRRAADTLDHHRHGRRGHERPDHHEHRDGHRDRPG